MRGLLITVVLVSAGCIQHTEMERRNAAVAMDLGVRVYKGPALEAKQKRQLARAVTITSQAVGPPEIRVDVTDAAAVDATADAAEKDIEKRGCWKVYVAGGIGLLEVGLTAFGLGGIAGFLGRARSKLEAFTRK